VLFRSFLSNNHPEFTAAMLTHFLQLLFEEELVKDGRPVQLPREFVERAQKWKEPLPAPAPGKRDEMEEPTEMVAFDGKLEAAGRPINFGQTPKFDEAPTPKPSFPWGKALALLVAAAAVGFGAVTVLQGMREARLEITSVPGGAEIVLDGKTLTERTPTKVSGLPGNSTHKLELLLPGYQSWKNEVPLKPGQVLVVEAKLELLPPPEPPKPPEPPPEPLKPPEPPPAPDIVSWPVSKFVLDAARHRIDLASSGATLVTLDPAKTYRVSLGGKGTTPGWGFYVVSDGGAQPGSFGADPLQIRSASKFFAFHVPASVLGAPGKDETKPRPLSVLLEGTRKAQIKQVPPKLTFPASQRVTVTGLSATTAYELTPRQGEPPALPREKGPPLNRVVVGTPAGLTIAALDETLRLENTTSFWVTWLDDETDSESGRLVLELREVRVPKKKRR
jgi:hypothetical protein